MVALVTSFFPLNEHMRVPVYHFRMSMEHFIALDKLGNIALSRYVDICFYTDYSYWSSIHLTFLLLKWTTGKCFHSIAHFWHLKANRKFDNDTRFRSIAFPVNYNVAGGGGGGGGGGGFRDCMLSITSEMEMKINIGYPKALLPGFLYDIYRFMSNGWLKKHYNERF